MKHANLRLAIVLLSAVMFAAGCTATRTQRSAGETIDDTTITAKVKAELVDNNTTNAGQIEVETYRGVVQLNGFVDSNEEKAAAARVAQSVAGVTRVENNLAIKSSQGSSSASTESGDRSMGEV